MLGDLKDRLRRLLLIRKQSELQAERRTQTVCDINFALCAVAWPSFVLQLAVRERED